MNALLRKTFVSFTKVKFLFKTFQAKRPFADVKKIPGPLDYETGVKAL